MIFSSEPESVPGGTSDKPDFLIVGIGASAGGIQALKEFFEHVPEDSAMAYVVILHLSPDHDSKLAEVLRVVSKIPVSQVTEKVLVEPDQVYVVSPNMHLVMEDGHLAVLPNLQIEDRRAPVDIFFRTLADSHGSSAVCVVLSGTGANGSMGLKRVKELGGAAFVQNPREAEFNEMPRHSIATDLVDEVLPVAAIPGKIIAYRNGMGVVKIPVETGGPTDDEQQALRNVFTQLRVRTGHDFSNYKRPTLLRRIERRINIRGLANLSAYSAFLQQHPDETNALLKDLLISVTNFFRDQMAFAALEQHVFPVLFQKTTAADQVRIWVAGCATGEEAYSLAMLCAEHTLSVIDAPKVQIFATDIDDGAIAHAREGYYTLNDAADVSPERLRRFFNREGDGFRVRREIREMILFADHNFIKDPPFSHLDLVTCRNVLIYLNHIAQERVLETFHFALKPGRFLFLGSSESVEGSGNLYATFNREQHIFQSRHVAARNYPIPESVPNFRFEQPKHPMTSKETEARALERITFGDLHQRLLEQYASPSIVINEDYNIVHLSDRAGRYLQIAGGEPSQNLLKLVHSELRMELRAALYQAIQRRSAVEVKGLQFRTDEQAETINILVRPVLRENDTARGFILVLFEQTTDQNAKPGDEAVERVMALQTDVPMARQFEEELIRIKSQLRASIEQHEFQSEELKASNEELQAMNEELRSAAEELETSKEELQSINEELRTVNQELKVKVEETTLAGNNLRNLINSLDFGTIFLDRSFRVSMFTPAIRDIFNLIPADYGRPLTDITNRLEYDGLLHDAEIVLEKLQTIEREVRTTTEKFFMMRVLPYRTGEDRINGIVITFIDITRRKQAELDLLESEKRFQQVAETNSFLVMLSDTLRSLSDPGEIRLAALSLLARHIHASRALYAEISDSRMAVAQEYVQGYPAMAGHYRADDFGHNIISSYRSGKTVVINDLQAYPGLSNTERNHYLKNSIGAQIGVPTVRNGDRVTALQVIHPAAREWTQQEIDLVQETATRTIAAVEKAISEQSLKESQERLRVTVESATDFAIITMDATGNIMGWNSGAEFIFGYHEAEVLGKSAELIFTAEDVAEHIFEQELQTANSSGKALDERWHVRKDGSRFFMSGITAAIVNEHIPGFVKIARDLTESRQAEEALRLSEERYRVALHSAEMGAWDWNILSDTVVWNDQHSIMLGVQPDGNEKKSSYFLQFIHPDDLDMVSEELLSAAHKTGVYQSEFRIIRPDGTQRWMHGYGRAVEWQEERAVRIVGVMYNITHRKILEKQKDEFIIIASHELKTPVTSIKAFVEVLQETLEASQGDDAVEVIRKLDKQVDRLNNLINDLLDTSKLYEGKLNFNITTFDLNQLIEEHIEELQRLSQKHTIALNRQELSPIRGDAERIGQVITNLLSNAVKYSPKSGEILVTTENVPAGVKVSVRDNGIGIRESYLSKVFDRFFRGTDQQTDTFPGMGLGLYISAGIISRHGGTISVVSELGKGTTFYFVLPFNGIK